MTQDEMKKMVAEAALEYVEPGTIIGIGSAPEGATIDYTDRYTLQAVEKLGQARDRIVAELRKTIEGSNKLLLTVNTLTEKFNVGEPSPEPKDSKPFDIKEYQDTIAEVTTLVESTNQLVSTVGLEKLLPEIVKTIDQVGNEGEELIDHSFRQAVLLILIAMGAYIVARLIYNFLNKKLIESRA